MPAIKISVIIPTYNYGGSVLKAIESVLPQLQGRHELIVVDDGSTDNTAQILAQYLQHHPGAFQYHSKPNGGAASARNFGIRQAAGDYLLFLDADDELMPDALQNIVLHLSVHPQSKVLIGGYISVWSSGKSKLHLPRPVAENPLQRLEDYLLRRKISLSHGASVMHRDVFERAGYPEQFRSAEDIPVFAQAIANNACSILEKPLVKIHKHRDSLRHQVHPAQAGGLALVDEVFSLRRLGPEFQKIKKSFFLKRCTTLFRIAYEAGDLVGAKNYLKHAVHADWRILIRRPSLIVKGAILWSRLVWRHFGAAR